MPRITVNSSSTKIRGSVSGSVVSEDTTLLDNEQSLQQQSPVNPEEGLRDTGAATSVTPTLQEGLVGSVNNDQDNLRANPSDGTSDNNGTALTEGVSPGEPRDGTDEEDLRPVVVDGDVRKLYTLRGAVTSIILNSDGSYNSEVYDILATLNSDDILPHVSVTDLNIDGDYKMVVTNAVKDGDSIKIWYSEQNGITGNSNLYYVTIYPDGSYTRQQHNIDDGFYKVGSDGNLYIWDDDAKQYVSTGAPFAIKYARNLLDSDDLFFKRTGDEGEEVIIYDPGTTGIVMWGAESTDQVVLDVNGVSKALLKIAALATKQDIISDLDAIRSGAALGATALQSETDPTVPAWAKRSSLAAEDVPQLTTSKISNIESWITSKGYVTNLVDNLANYYLNTETYTKDEVNALIASINQFHFEIYPTLPAVGESNVLYLIGPISGTDVYEEYVYTNNQWTRIGSTSIDLSGYVQITRTITAGTGLTGGGDLSVNRTIALSSATLASLALANSAYQLPETGVARTDLARDVRDSLTLADNAVQLVDLAGYVNQLETVGTGNYVSSITKRDQKLTVTYHTLPTTIGLENVIGADDLRAIEALDGFGFAKRTGVNTWALDTNTYALASDLAAAVLRITALENRTDWDQYFGIDEHGDIFVRQIDENTPRNFYSFGGVTAYGTNSGGGGGGGIDLARVWESLSTNTDVFGTITVHPDHIPTITLSGDITGSGKTTIATTIGEGRVTNAMLAGGITNAKLVNSGITIGSATVALGGIKTLTEIGVPAWAQASNLAFGSLPAMYIGNARVQNSEQTAQNIGGIGNLTAQRLYLADGVYLYYDSENEGIKVVGAGLYSDSYLTAFGINSGSGGGGGGIDLSRVWSSLANSSSFVNPGNTAKIHTDHLPTIVANDGLTGSWLSLNSSTEGSNLVTTLTLGISSIAQSKVNGLESALAGKQSAYPFTITGVTGTTYNLADIISLSGRVTTLETTISGRTNWDDYFGIDDTTGAIYVKRKASDNAPRDFFSYGAVTAYGVNGSGGGGGGINLARVWESLTTNTDTFGSSIIHPDHIPDYNRLSFVKLNEGEDVTIYVDPGVTGTVLWGVESQTLVDLNVNGAQKTLVKSSALTSINSSISTLQGYFTNGVANNAAALNGHADSYFATSVALNNLALTVATKVASIKREGDTDAYTPDRNGLVTIPAYPTTLPASDVYAWAKKQLMDVNDVPGLPWSKITSGTPTTIAGYGIIDAYISGGAIRLGDNTITPVTSLAGYATENYVNTRGFITKTVNDLTNYYLKSETYTQTEVNALIAAIDQFRYEIYASISLVTDPQSNVLYLIGPKSVSGNDKYDEYVYTTEWVKIGETSIDLSGYLTIAAAVQTYQPLDDDLTEIASKTGAGLLRRGYNDHWSLDTNDYLTTHQTIYSLAVKDSGGTSQLNYNPAVASGEITLTKAMVGLGNVENQALSSWTGATSINTLGTITTGEWHGTVIANDYLANKTIGVGNATIALGGSASLSQIGVAQWAQTQNSTIDFSALPNLYIGTTAVQDTQTPEALAGITTLNMSGALTLSGSTSSARRIYFGDANHYLELDSNGFHFSHGVYSDDFITAYGIGSSGGGSGVDLPRVWQSLTNSVSPVTPDANTKIAVAHIPDITTAKVSDIETWIVGKGYLTDYTIYGLTVNNSEGSPVLSYNPKTAAGLLNLTKAMVGLSNVENTALSTWTGSQNITTLGTIATGVWNGTPIANSKLALDMSWVYVGDTGPYDSDDFVTINAS